MRRSITVGRGRSAPPATTLTASAHRVVTAIREHATVGVGDDGLRVVDCPPDDAEAVLAVDASDAEFQALLELARQPLPELDDTPARGLLSGDLTSTLHELAASGQLANREAVSAALSAVGVAHQQSMEAIREVLVASGGSGAPDTLTLAALSVLDGFARRPADPAPTIHVHTPKHDLNVHVDTPELHPNFQVELHSPAIEMPPAQVTINVPEPVVQAAATPVINVTLPAPAEKKPSGVRVEYDDEGFKHFVPVYEEGA